jgi:tRNA nucleotidyltransferase (CCA-adding enzyme)
MTTGNSDRPTLPRWEHFDHDADMGIRGIAPALAQAFEQAATALTAVITDPEGLIPSETVSIRLVNADPEILFLDWINELIFQMASRGLLFGRYRVAIANGELTATASGEAVDIARHQPAVEIKGATFTELRVYRNSDGLWVAQCVVDV